MNSYWQNESKPDIQLLNGKRSSLMVTAPVNIYQPTTQANSQSTTRIGLLFLTLSVISLSINAGLLSALRINFENDRINGKNSHRTDLLRGAFEWGKFIGACLSITTIESIGRRSTLLLFSIPMILGWFFTATFSSIYIITFAYLLKGISIGGGLASMFILITECATPIWRNCLIVSVYLSYYFGLVVPTIIENFIHRDNIIWFGLFASIKIAYFIYLTPSSPIWLARTGKYEQCLHDLLWLRGDIIIANDELDTIIQIINNESKDFQYIEENICETCFRRSVARSLMSVVMLKIFVWITDLQYLSTNNATTIFSNDINHMQAFCILFIAFILLNRRHFTVGCGLISAINIFCYGLYIKFVTTSIELNTILLLTKWTMSILYSITNSVFHIVPIFIITEIQPTHKRGPVVASSFAVYFFIKNVAQILCAPLFGSSLTVKILSTPGLFMFLAFFALVLTVIIALMLTDKKSNRNLTLTL